MLRRIDLRWSLGVIAAVLAGSASAQGDAARSYPNRPVRVVVGLAAGGGTDLVARMLAPKLQDFRDTLGTKLVEAASGTSEELSQFISAEIARWDAVRKAANIKPSD